MTAVDVLGSSGGHVPEAGRQLKAAHQRRSDPGVRGDGGAAEVVKSNETVDIGNL